MDFVDDPVFGEPVTEQPSHYNLDKLVYTE